MTNKDYIKFYNECLKQHMTIKKYEPVKDYLFTAIKHMECLRIDYPDMSIDDCSKDILRCFSTIMKYKKYDNLNEYIAFLNILKTYYYTYPQLLKTIVLKDKAFEDVHDIELSKNYYNHWIDYLCRLSLHWREKVLDFDGNTRIVNMMKIVAKNGRETLISRNRNTYLEKKSDDYCRFAKNIITELYLCDMDLEYLDNFLYCLFNDYDETMSYLLLNKLIEKQHPGSSYYILVNPLQFLPTFDKPKTIIR